MASGEAVKKAGRLARLGAWAVRVGKATPPYVKRKSEVFWYYAKVELKPPTSAEFPEIKSSFQRSLTTIKSGAWKNMAVKDVILSAAVAGEVFVIFFFGECLGKRSFVGYNVPLSTAKPIEEEKHHFIHDMKEKRRLAYCNRLKEIGAKMRAEEEAAAKAAGAAPASK